jgi:heptosyltransferase-2
MRINLDCVHYRSEKPCAFARLCDGCPEYLPVDKSERGGERVLIIKTAALGDVLRTTTILPAVRRARSAARVTWLTSPAALPLLKGNPDIDALVAIGSAAASGVFPAEFDLILSLDKSPAECALATALRAREKRGMGITPLGAIYPFNPEAEYYFSLGLSDELKFRTNKRTHADMLLEACGLGGAAPEPPQIVLTEDEKREGLEFARGAGARPGGRVLGLVAGAGDAFANKTPSPEKWAEIAREIKKTAPDAALLILGGPGDETKMRAVADAFGGAAMVVSPTTDLRAFASIIAAMDAIVCGDTLALHMASAVGVPAVALFGPTCPAEIDMFSGGEKVVSSVECAPCYKKECKLNPNCMDAISGEEVAQAAAEALRVDIPGGPRYN